MAREPPGSSQGWASARWREAPGRHGFGVQQVCAANPALAASNASHAPRPMPRGRVAPFSARVKPRNLARPAQPSVPSAPSAGRLTASRCAAPPPSPRGRRSWGQSARPPARQATEQPVGQAPSQPAQKGSSNIPSLHSAPFARFCLCAALCSLCCPAWKAPAVDVPPLPGPHKVS